MRATTAPDKQNTRIAVWVFLTFLPVYLLVGRGHFQSTDEVAVFQQARSVWERGDFDVVPMLNTRLGRGGRHYAVYGAGQSIVASPLYAAGKWLGKVLDRNSEWTRTFAGPVVGKDPIRWGGQIDIFTVSTFGAFVTALTCALFFLLSRQLGSDVPSALAAVGLFGTSTALAGYSSTFFQHPLESLTILACFYQLLRDASAPSIARRAVAGLLAGFAIVVRIHTLMLLPALSCYLLWNVWQRRLSSAAGDRRSVLYAALECAPYFGLVAVGFGAQFAINYVKFGELTFTGAYAGGRFDTSLLTTWFGLFFSPGASIFVFTPLLLLIPCFWPRFYQRHRAESYCALGLTLSYLLFYGKYEFWHGQWCFGPRYLLAITPFLLLPLASWWGETTNRWRAAALALGAAGVFVQTLALAVNFSYVWYFENYSDYKPAFGFLFIPSSSQIATHFRALVAGDHRLDMWLVNVYREFGMGRVLVVALPLLTLLGISVYGLRRAAMTRSRAAIRRPFKSMAKSSFTT